MPVFGHLLKKETFRIGPTLQAEDLIGRRNELPGQFDDARVGPHGPPARHAIVSGASEGMTIHGPKQKRFSRCVGGQDAVFEGR